MAATLACSASIELIVRPLGTRPFVFCGAVGPVPLPDDVAARVTAAVRALAAAFSLRGLGSLDFMLDGDTFGVLEVNPRPPASMALYGRHYVQSASQGRRRCHRSACACLPAGRAAAEPAAHLASDTVHGTEIVFAPRPAVARRACRRSALPSVPIATICRSAPTRFDAGDPICSVQRQRRDAEQVRAMLDDGREAVHQSLEIDP